MPHTPLQPMPMATPLADVALHDSTASRRIEAHALAAVPPFTLMARAGWAIARLARAIAPHTREVWVLAGPGHNGGDGLVAATALKQAGLSVGVSLLGQPQQLPPDAARAHAQALAAGVTVQADWPARPPGLVIDALLGLGHTRPPEGRMAAAVDWLNARPGGHRVLAVDLPTGLCGDTGRCLGSSTVRADVTLALLTLKPGLYTAQGRDQAGQVWLDDLGAGEALDASSASAWLTGLNTAMQALPPRQHAQHKGSFGDVWVLGGAAGMQGAAVLAARAALAAGAGRVFLAPLAVAALTLDGDLAALMCRHPDEGLAPGIPEASTVVCGCGGGEAVLAVMPALLARARRLVLDADALNALAQAPALVSACRQRAGQGRATVLTPHPLEAARLLGRSTAAVQADRLGAAQALAEQYQAVVVLKGSGSIVAAPGAAPFINPTGNARLAMPGAGDVLAGWLGGLWAQQAALAMPPSAEDQASGTQGPALQRLAAAATWLHGQTVSPASAQRAGGWPRSAADLPDRLRHTLDALRPAP